MCPAIASDCIFSRFAIGNLLGPPFLGPLFDSLGRRIMITFTYGLSAILLGVFAWLFHQGLLTATWQTIFWCVIFFFASAGASSAYLTVSEIFPLELRGQAIAFFFAISQLVGGVAAPTIFATLVGNGTRVNPLAIGYLVGAGIMFLGGVIGWFLRWIPKGRHSKMWRRPFPQWTSPGITVLSHHSDLVTFTRRQEGALINASLHPFLKSRATLSN